ncbi:MULTISPECIES: hypothetical protein [Bacteroides]
MKLLYAEGGSLVLYIKRL